MSRLTDLIAQLKVKDSQLALDLEKEIKVLSSRLPFGLNFERHSPELVQLPGKRIRKNDKVQILNERGSLKKTNPQIWIVKNIIDHKMAVLESIGLDETQHKQCSIDDLVCVIQFRDKIYPGLVSTGKVQNGADKPFHTVINGENYHVLKALTFTHRGTVDVVYIDPPYNSGAKDWKYNNDYVEADDIYRHSKWLAMMERRLLIAKELLNPNDSVLIVTIDEKEYLRLGMLLEQTFTDAKIQMVSLVINPKGTGRLGDFARTNEFIYFVRFGKCKVGLKEDESAIGKEVAWETMRRRNLASVRGRKGKGACGPNQFYPIFVDETTCSIIGRGDCLPVEKDISEVVAPKGCIAVFPIRKDGTEMNWEYSDKAFDEWFSKGYIRANGFKDEPQKCIIQHLPNKVREGINNGSITIKERLDNGVVVVFHEDSSTKSVTTQWNETSHSAEHGGTGILKAIIPNRIFPFPKSLYAVEDSISLFIKDKKDAVVLDFFSGSGTTAHAVMRLNKRDGGSEGVQNSVSVNLTRF